MKNGLMILATISGFFAVAFGAFGAHSLKNFATDEVVNIFNIGVEYHFYHTFAIMILALAAKEVKSRLLNWSGYLFISGIILFSGSLYLYALLGTKWTGPITPIGGFCFLMGWALFAVAIWRNRIKQFEDADRASLR